MRAHRLLFAEVVAFSRMPLQPCFHSSKMALANWTREHATVVKDFMSLACFFQSTKSCEGTSIITRVQRSPGSA